MAGTCRRDGYSTDSVSHALADGREGRVQAAQGSAALYRPCIVSQRDLATLDTISTAELTPTHKRSAAMNTIDAVYRRRAVKQFYNTHNLTEAEERKLLEATIQAPTSFNIQHWRFVILRDPELRARIRREFGNDQAQMTDASLLVLFTADLKAWQKYKRSTMKNAIN